MIRVVLRIGGTVLRVGAGTEIGSTWGDVTNTGGLLASDASNKKSRAPMRSANITDLWSKRCVPYFLRSVMGAPSRYLEYFMRVCLDKKKQGIVDTARCI